MGSSKQRRKAAALVGEADLLQSQGRLAEAIPVYEAALRLDADLGEGCANLGLALLHSHRPVEAVSYLERAARLLPRVAMVHFNLGNAYRACQRDAEAEASWRQALALQPAFSAVQVNLADLAHRSGRDDEATAMLHQAIEVDPLCAAALVNLASMVQEAGRDDEAIVLLHRALKIDPRCAVAWLNFGNVFLSRGRLDDALGCYRQALEIDASLVIAHSNVIFALDLVEQASYAELKAERVRWGQRFAAPLAGEWRPHANPPDPERRLRVGYVSGDFRVHSAAYCFLPVLAHHDHAQVEVTCYHASSREDAMTSRFRACADRWRRVDALSDPILADVIREDGIDILVDLSGHSAGHRLLTFARRPAPVQVTAWGHATGTGLEAMDYLFSDEVVIPPEFECYHVEKIWRLPCTVCFEPVVDAPPVGPLPLLQQGVVTYGCINRFSKVTPHVLEVWGALLREAPTARLLLKDPLFDSSGPRDAVTATFAGLGVDPSRLVLLGRSPRHEHLDACNRIDVALDPFPHGGGITALECLWMGVPSVTMLGERPAARLNASLLGLVGLSERFVATSEEHYLRLALQQAADVEALAATRAGLREATRRAPMCDGQAYCSAVEEAYRSMWRLWCQSRP